jgi:hypothetical protein
VIANGPWLAERRIASRYRQGRAFLLGDAAHLHPPTGGYGMNMGIGDAVDLGWKLAAVLRGWGGETLLESYELERRPIHRRVIDEAAANYAASPTAYRPPELERDGPDADAVRRNLGATIRAEKSREWASIGVQLGYRYDSSPIIVADGTEPTPDEVGEYVPTARPGHLAPHAWIDERRCVYDLLGREFTLLELGGSGAGARAFASAAEACGVPLSVVTPDRTWLRDLYGADLVLVRPDQHVAWRGDDFEHAAAVVDVVRGAAGRRSSR